MKSLLDSGINIEVINEVKSALIEQQKKEIDDIVIRIKNEFVSKGYLETEISTDIEICSYVDQIYLKISLKTPDGVLNYGTTKHISFLYVSTSNIKAVNLAIKKVELFYVLKQKEEIAEIKEAIKALTVDKCKLSTDYKEPQLYMDGIDYNWSRRFYYYCVNYSYSNSSIKVTGEELDKINSLISLYKENVEKKRVEEASQKLALKENLKAWALKNGSELVKARIEEDMNWVELAETEYDKGRMPEGFDYKNEDNYESCWDYKNPTLEHIHALREARKNEVFTKVELRKCRETDEDGDKTFYFFIVATMISYDGTEFEVTKLIE